MAVHDTIRVLHMDARGKVILPGESNQSHTCSPRVCARINPRSPCFWEFSLLWWLIGRVIFDIMELLVDYISISFRHREIMWIYFIFAHVNSWNYISISNHIQVRTNTYFDFSAVISTSVQINGQCLSYAPCFIYIYIRNLHHHTSRYEKWANALLQIRY